MPAVEPVTPLSPASSLTPGPISFCLIDHAIQPFGRLVRFLVHSGVPSADSESLTPRTALLEVAFSWFPTQFV